MTTIASPTVASPAIASVSAVEAKLLALLTPIFPDLHKVNLIGSPIVQQSAVGYRCSLDDGALRVFVKHVDAAAYCGTKKDWNDLRRALLYARTEARFYTAFRPRLRSLTPHVHHASWDLAPLISDGEHVADPGARPRAMPGSEECKGKGGLLVLELVEEEEYLQASPLSIAQCKQCLTAVAGLHRAAWGDVELLKCAVEELSVPTFHLKLRNPKELAGIEGAWERFRGQFEAYFSAELWGRTATLATRLKGAAEYISEQLSPEVGGGFKYATLVHGDCKAMNAFLKREGDGALLVDFAAASVASPMCDVAMHVFHAVMWEELEAEQPSGLSGEMELMEHYLQALGVEYPKEVALYHYKLAFCDYLRFFLGRMWATATVESMRRNEWNPNIAKINRYPAEAIAAVDKADAYLTEIEERRWDS